MDSTLVILSPLRGLRLPNGNILLTEKFIDGMKLYRELWKGPVLHLCEPADAPSHNLDNMEIPPNSSEFDTVCAPFTNDFFRSRLPRNSLVVTSVGQKFNSVSRICKALGLPCIYIAEYTLKTRHQQISETRADPIRKLWRKLRETQQEHSQRSAIALASGIQCNGLPTFLAYKELTSKPHLFFDTRVTSDMLATPDQVSKRFQNRIGKKLRLTFSGRLTLIKGVDDLILVARHLRSLLDDWFELSICGDGDYAEQLRRDIAASGLADLVILRGNMDFKTELVPFLREQTDIFVCCHRQGDPSCTYLETMSCGVPIVGYDNEAWSTLSDYSRTGIRVKMRDTRSMAERIAKLASSEYAIESSSLEALKFATDHTFERTFRRRVEHFKEVAESQAT